MATMNISLPETLRDFVKVQINNGGYSSNSDYVRDLIRKDQLRREKIEALQAKITQGLESGDAQSLDVASLIARAKREAGLDV